MANGWTGGQYSLYRAIFGLCLIVRFAQLAPTSAPAAAILAPIAIAFAACFAIGKADRLAALALLAIGALLFAGGLSLAEPTAFFFGALLLAHACIPGRPYGSLDARGRPDPGGGWRMPDLVHLAGWIVLVASYAWDGYTAFATRGTITLGLFAAPLALVSRARPWLWLALLASSDPSLGRVLLHAFTFDPAWLKPLRDAEPARLFYDGACGLCHAAVRFVLAEDPEGRAFRFAPLEAESFAAAVPSDVRATLPDSLVLLRPDGKLLLRAAAVREICARLGGIWRALGIASHAVPLALLDRAYDVVARVRKRVFAKPIDACPLVPVDLRARFLIPPPAS
jgi:predicted DCC family thiol-disulfide oxidoreductase YuxK